MQEPPCPSCLALVKAGLVLVLLLLGSLALLQGLVRNTEQAQRCCCR